MSFLFHHLRSLRWRLTLSYTLLNIAVILALEVTHFITVDRHVFDSPDIPSVLADQLATVGPRLAPNLLRAPVDQTGLIALLTSWQRSQGSNQLSYDRTPSPASEITGSSLSLLVVVDPAGRVLATNDAGRVTPGTLLPVSLSAGTGAVLRAALAGEADRSYLAVRSSDGGMAAAVPILGPKNETIGVLLLALDGPAELTLLRAHEARAFIVNVIPPSVIICLIGSLVGFGWASWVARRLRGLTVAVDAWSGGNLDAVAHDPIDDELGQLARQLNRMAEQLRNLLQERQTLAVVEERQRLSRELHDAVKQQVFATSMQVGAARRLLPDHPEAAAARLVEAQGLAVQAQQELTSLIHQLRPVALGDRGLATALDEAVRDWSRQTNIAAEIRIQGERATPLSAEQGVFRVAQEALANVARHSQATFVDVHLAWGPDELTLVVSDNGKGFDPRHEAGEGVGLSSMAERLHALGGRLGVESSPEGTRLEARVALSSGSRERHVL